MWKRFIMGKKYDMSKAKHIKYPAGLTAVDNFHGATEKAEIINIHKIKESMTSIQFDSQ